MLARPKELGLTPADPFKGGVVVHPYPAALDTDMHQAFELGVSPSSFGLASIPRLRLSA